MDGIRRERAEVAQDPVDRQTGRVGETLSNFLSTLLVVELGGLVFDGLVSSFAEVEDRGTVLALGDDGAQSLFDDASSRLVLWAVGESLNTSASGTSAVVMLLQLHCNASREYSPCR